MFTEFLKTSCYTTNIYIIFGNTKNLNKFDSNILDKTEDEDEKQFNMAKGNSNDF